eukprot:756563-Hanusia_phi.AAC.4
MKYSESASFHSFIMLILSSDVLSPDRTREEVGGGEEEEREFTRSVSDVSLPLEDVQQFDHLAVDQDPVIRSLQFRQDAIEQLQFAAGANQEFVAEKVFVEEEGMVAHFAELRDPVAHLLLWGCAVSKRRIDGARRCRSGYGGGRKEAMKEGGSVENEEGSERRRGEVRCEGVKSRRGDGREGEVDLEVEDFLQGGELAFENILPRLGQLHDVFEIGFQPPRHEGPQDRVKALDQKLLLLVLDLRFERKTSRRKDGRRISMCVTSTSSSPVLKGFENHSWKSSFVSKT